MKNQITLRLLFSLAILLFVGLFPAISSSQELSREVREKFETMLPDLDGAIKIKFQKALDNNTPVVELTAEQFRKFRDNPVNPFDINDIDPDDLDGNIELRFELPSLRNRPARPFERQSRSLRRNLRMSVKSAAASTVKIMDGNEQIAMGVVIRSDGIVLTKFSEIEAKENVRCQIGLGPKYKAKLLKSDERNDIALLKIPANNLTPVVWSNRQPRNGIFVANPNHLGEVFSLGTYSVVPRSTLGENQGFLGVAPRTVSSGVEITEPIESNTAAFSAGLQQGDVITKIDGKVVAEAYQLTDEIRKRTAGDKIRIDFLRNGYDRSTTAKLASRTLSGDRAGRFKMMSRLGAVPSERKSEFPVVFQHDSPLFPEQCGGPICDLAGNVLGVNIARESRAASYAIPSSHIQSLVNEMLRFDVAAADLDESR